MNQVQQHNRKAGIIDNPANKIEALTAITLQEIQKERIKLSIQKIENADQIPPTIKWISLFEKRFNDKKEADYLRNYLEKFTA